MKKESLSKQLSDMKESVGYYKERYDAAYKRADEAEKELRKVQGDKIMVYKNDLAEEQEKSRLLFEIIRWHMNPETAKDPFNHLEINKKHLPNY